MKRNISMVTGLFLCALPVATVLVGCSGGTGGLSGLGSSVTTPSSFTNPTPAGAPGVAATLATPNGTVTPTPDPAKLTFDLPVTDSSSGYTGSGPNGLPLSKAELKTVEGVTTLEISYGAPTSGAPATGAPTSLFELALIKKGELAVGDVFTFGAGKGARATTTFSSVAADESKTVFAFARAKTPATATITAIDGGNYTIELSDVGYSTDTEPPATFHLKGTLRVGLYGGKVAKAAEAVS